MNCCRIDRVVDGDNLVVLCISGKLTGHCVCTLRSVLRKERGALAIDLKEVSLVGREAVQLLALIESNVTELRNCPAYVREWITREITDMQAERSDHGEEGGHRL